MGISDREGNQGDAGNKLDIEVSEIIDGLGDRVARRSDKVRIKYQLYGKAGRVKVEKGPLELILGTQHKYGQGFEYGILGMKIEGTRELKIPRHLCPHNMPTNWKNIVGISSKEKKKFGVTLLDILETQQGRSGVAA